MAVALNIRPDDSAAARFAGFDHFCPDAILGLTPQALCWCPLRGLSLGHPAEYLYGSGLDRAGALVIHENDAIRADYAFRHLECRRDGALGKQPLSSAQRERIYHQPEHIDQILLDKRLK